MSDYMLHVLQIIGTLYGLQLFAGVVTKVSYKM